MTNRRWGPDYNGAAVAKRGYHHGDPKRLGRWRVADRRKRPDGFTLLRPPREAGVTPCRGLSLL
jgi:hypothetical protein